MSGSSSWPPPSGLLAGPNTLLTNSSGPRAPQLTNSDGAECQQLDIEQLYVNMSTFWYCFLALITTLGLLVSLVSNTIIIYLFTKTPSLRRNPSNIIAVNLSLSDLLYCIQWPSVIYCSLSQSTWMLEIDLLCQTFGFLTVSTAWASILTVLAMSIERAIVIGYSMHAKSRVTVRRAWLIVVLIWIVSIFSSLPPLFGKFNRYTLDPSKTSCTLDYLSSKTNYKLYILALYIAYWITPAIVITICYVTIIVTFKRSSRSLKLVSKSPSARAPSESSASQLDNELSTISGVVSQPATRQSSPLGRDFAHRSGPHFDFKLSRRRLRDSIKLHTLAGSFRLRQRARSGGQNSTGPSTMAPQKELAVKQLEARTSGSSSRAQMPTAPGNEAAGLGSGSGAGAMENKVNLIQSTGAKITLPRAHQESRDWMQIVAKSLERAVQPPLNCQDVTSCDHLTGSASSCVTNQTGEQPGDVGPGGSGRNRQLTVLASARRRYSSSRLSNFAAASAARCSRPDSLDEPDNFKDTFVQVTAGPRANPSSEHVVRHRVGIRRARTSHDLRRGKHGAAGRMSDATAILSLNRSSSHLRLQSHKFAATIRSLVGGSRQATPRSSQQPHTLASGWSSSCHIGTSGAHLSRTGLQIRLAKMSFYLILLWFISWTPIASLAMIHSVFKCHHRTSALAVFTANTMTKLGPAFDVFIYGISHPVIKSKFKMIIKRIFLVGQNGQQASSINRRPFERSKQICRRSNLTSQEGCQAQGGLV